MSEISTLNVCLVTKLFPPSSGGAETYSYELSKRLAKKGHNVDIYTQSFPNKTAQINLHENITVNRITTTKPLGVIETLYFSYKCRKDIHFSDYDIIHSELRPPSTIFFTPGLGMEDVPVVVLSRGTSYDAARHTSINTPVDIVVKYVLQSSNIILLGSARLSKGVI